MRVKPRNKDKMKLKIHILKYYANDVFTIDYSANVFKHYLRFLFVNMFSSVSAGIIL